MLEVAVTETLSSSRVFYDTLPVAVGWEVEVVVAMAVAVGNYKMKKGKHPTPFFICRAWVHCFILV